MKRSEVLEMLVVAESFYGNRFKVTERVVKAWHLLFHNVDGEGARASMLQFAAHSRWPPTPAEIIEGMIVDPNQRMSAGVAWEAARGCMSEHPFLDTPVVEDSKLPCLVRRAMVAVGVRSVYEGGMAARAHFFRVFNDVVQAEAGECRTKFLGGGRSGFKALKDVGVTP